MDCLAAILARDLIHGNHLTHRETSEDPAARFESATLVCSGMLHGRNPILRFDGSVYWRTGKLVARSEEMNRDTSPTPRFARTLATWNLRSHVEEVYPHNFVVESQRLQISTNSLHLPLSRI